MNTMETTHDHSHEHVSIWWKIAGLVASSAAALGIGFKLGSRHKPCACKALPQESEPPKGDSKPNPNSGMKG